MTIFNRLSNTIANIQIPTLKFEIPQILNGRTTQYSAVSISYAAVVLIILTKPKNSDRVSADIRVAQTPRGAMTQDGTITNRTAIINTLKELAEGKKVQNVVAILRADDIRWGPQDVPGISPEDISRSIEHNVTVPEDTYMAYKNLGKSMKGSKFNTVLITQAKRHLIDEYAYIFEEAGYQLAVIDTLPNALHRAVKASGRSRVIALDLEPETTTYLYLQNDQFIESRRLNTDIESPFTMNQLSQALSCQIPYFTEEEATHFLYSKGLYPEEDDQPNLPYSSRQAGEIIRQALQPLAIRLSKLCTFCGAKYNGPPDTLILTGGASRIDGLDHFLKTELSKQNVNLQVVKWKPNDILKQHGILISNASKNINATITTALGAALRHLADNSTSPETFNILPEHHRHTEVSPVRRIMKAGFVTTGIVATAFGGWLTFFGIPLVNETKEQWKTYSQQLHGIETEIKDLEAKVKANQVFLDRIQTARNQVRWSNTLRYTGETPSTIGLIEVRDHQFIQPTTQPKAEKQDAISAAASAVKSIVTQSSPQPEPSPQNQQQPPNEKRTYIPPELHNKPVVVIRGAASSAKDATEYYNSLKTYGGFKRVELIGIEEDYLKSTPFHAFEIVAEKAIPQNQEPKPK